MSEWIKLKSQNCTDCYKCIRHCRVNAIRFSGNLAYNVENLCVLCGHCYISCPQNAKTVVSEVEKVKNYLNNEKVVALVSPTYLSYFNTNYTAFKKALLKLGFSNYEEETLGYEIVLKEYDRILKKKDKDIYISSYCHSLNLLVQKYFPKLLPNLIDVVSPMIASAIDIKKRMPKCKIVYIGPCVAKKDEAERYNKLIDGVLMFDEIQKMLSSAKISLDKKVKDRKKFKARQAIEYRGIEKLLKQNDKYHFVSISGIENCMYSLKELESKKAKNVFVIMDVCTNSCLSGPTFQKYNRFNIENTINIQNHYGDDIYFEKDYKKEAMVKYFDAIKLEKKMPSKKELAEIFRLMGKDKPEKMLNCGVCGYSTCLNKAIAIYNGMAEPDMCVSYFKEKVENFKDNVINKAPVGFITLNAKFEIQIINKFALGLFNLNDEINLMGHPLQEIMDVKEIKECFNEEKSGLTIEKHLNEYNKDLVEIIVIDKERQNILVILQDITDKVFYKKKKESIDKNTIEIADKVIDKQMMIVQQIASLLGETAAETKVALTKMKESLKDE